MLFLRTVCLPQGQNEAEIKKLRHSLNLKTTPTRGSYRGQKMSKSTSEKVYSVIVVLSYGIRSIVPFCIF